MVETLNIQKLLQDPRVLEAVKQEIMGNREDLIAFYNQMMKEQQGIPRVIPITNTHVGSDTQNDTTTLSGDNDFVLTHMSGFATSINFTLQIRDDRLGWDLFKDPVQAEHFFGDHSSYYFDGPYYFSVPYKFNRAGSFVVTTVDASGSANTVQLALHGLLIKTGNNI